LVFLLSPNYDEISRKAVRYIEDNYNKYIDLLGSLVEYKTVAAWGGDDMARCADYLASILRERGFKTQIKSGGGHPVVLAEVGSGSKSVLIYNHYDVQPPDPVELWESDPFKLSKRGDYLFARGVADNKGNIAARIGAIDAIIDSIDKLDLKIKFFIEGEEEIGSPTLERVIQDNREWIRSDGGIWETGYIRRDDRLGISLGFKGMLYIEIILKGASRDVHSGNAPLVPNPVWRMVRLLSLLKDEHGRIYVPGFYDDIDPEFVRAGEELVKKMDTAELEEMMKDLGLKSFVGGVSGYEALRKLHLEPSLNVSGLYSGYTGKGSKTIVPSIAGAKIDIRPVPGQDPEKILSNLKKYLKENGFEDAQIVVHSMYRSGYTKPGEAIVRATVNAAIKAYGKEPSVSPLSGGSGPMYYFTNIAGTPMSGAGVGYYGSKAHAPNENIRVRDFVNGMKHFALTLIEFSALARK
jgi:acetylornithine deacetylase/succinyl-diaminopimelate desuccinylase-like protein